MVPNWANVSGASKSSWRPVLATVRRLRSDPVTAWASDKNRSWAAARAVSQAKTVPFKQTPPRNLKAIGRAAGSAAGVEAVADTGAGLSFSLLSKAVGKGVGKGIGKGERPEGQQRQFSGGRAANGPGSMAPGLGLGTGSFRLEDRPCGNLPAWAQPSSDWLWWH